MEPMEQVVEVPASALAPGQPAVLVVDLPPAPALPVATPPGMPPPPAPQPTACAFARGTATGGGVRVGVLDASLAAWMAARYGPPRAEPPGIAGDCDGLPPVHALTAPPSGWVIGLRAPPTAPVVGGEVEVHPIGADRRWWHLHAAGRGVVAFGHPADPPTRFTVDVDPTLVAPPARTVEVPRGGAVVVDLGAGITHAEVPPTGAVRLEVAGRHLVVLGPGHGDAPWADAVIRVGDAPPEPVRIAIGAPLGADPREIRVRAGGTRRLTVDTEVRAAWVADPEIATVALDPRGQKARIIVSGTRPGRTALVIAGADGPRVVPVAVGN